MHKSSEHIISRVRWNSSFNKKEKAAELQERLSSWSKVYMQGEIKNIFDEICPPGQIWKIRTLELDLGAIDYNNLEAELLKKLRDQLNEALVDLAVNTGGAGQSNITILNEDISYISMLHTFLVSGLMPWNYKSEESINRVMAYQLQHNRRNVIIMLREAGITHVNVRKRIALQINEPNIIKIIQGLEPGSHSQIIDFSAELVNIQNQEMIVQASIVDFKEHLWFWILNHLLTERGTIFNKRAFMKSSIVQMAAHYNTGYEELLEWIGEAIGGMKQSMNVKTDFVLTLKELSKENIGVKKKPGIAEHSIDLLVLLEELLKDEGLRRTQQGRNELNDLVTGLAQQRGQSFQRLITRMSRSGHLIRAVNELNDLAIETIITTLDPVHSGKIVESIYLIDRLCKKMKLGVMRKLLWTLAMQFLEERGNSVFNNFTFIDECVTGLAKKNNISKISLLDKLTNAALPSSAKSFAALDTYEDMKAVYISSISGAGSALFEARFTECLKQLALPANRNAVNKSSSIALQKALLKYIRLHPSHSLKVLTEYEDKKRLSGIVADLIDESDAILLLRSGEKETSKVLFITRNILSGLKADRKVKEAAEWMGSQLIFQGLQAIILHPGYNSSRLLTHLLDHFSRQCPVRLSGQFALLIDKLLADEKWSKSEISIGTVNIGGGLTNALMHCSLMDRVEMLMTSSLSTPQELEKVLCDNFTHASFIQLRESSDTRSVKMEDHFLPGGKESMARHIGAYASVLEKEFDHLSHKEIALQLNELYWKCLVKYSMHHGNVDVLKNKFDAAIRFHFPSSAKNTSNSLTNTPCPVTGSPESNDIARSLILKEAGRLLLKCESTGVMESLCSDLIRYAQVPLWINDSGVHTAEELLEEILVHYPDTFRLVLKRESFSEVQLDRLDRLIGLGKLIQSISRMHPDKRSQLSILIDLYTALGSLTLSGITAKEVQALLFRKVIAAWTAQNWRIISIENTWNELLWEAGIKKGIAKKDLITALAKMKTSFPLSLQLSLEHLVSPQKRSIISSNKAVIVKGAEHASKQPDRFLPARGGISIGNAGLVLVSSYIPTLLERLDIVKDKKHLDPGVQYNAVHYLQYLVTGSSHTEESLLALNKILCGIPLSQPVPGGIEIMEKEHKLIEGLIRAVIGYWPSIGESSINGFRGNWLVREGVLTEQEERWDLTVEKRAYDLLIERSPFSFSIIKYPWMNKPVHVYWSY